LSHQHRRFGVVVMTIRMSKIRNHIVARGHGRQQVITTSSSGSK
jgi:hypothetical protein